jgi:hypothetical protein
MTASGVSQLTETGSGRFFSPRRDVCPLIKGPNVTYAAKVVELSK